MYKRQVVDYLDADERIKQYLPYNQVSINMEGERTIEGYLFTVADGDDLEGLVELRTRQDHQPVTLSDDGLVLTEKAADLLGVDVYKRQIWTQPRLVMEFIPMPQVIRSGPAGYKDMEYNEKR